MINLNSNNITFSARKIATVELDKVKPEGTTSLEKADVDIYSLEERDIPYLESLVSKNEKNELFAHCATDKNNAANLREIIDDGINAIVSDLKLVKFLNPPYEPVNLLALSEGKPVGIFSGMSPKLDKELNIVYAATGIQGEAETDWIACWNGPQNTRMKGLGKVLSAFFFDKVKKTDFPLKSFYTRSETPDKSIACNFYESIGYKKTGNKVPMITHNEAVEINNIFSKREYSLDEAPAIPMRIDAETAAKTTKKVFDSCNKKDVENPESIDLFSVSGL